MKRRFSILLIPMLLLASCSEKKQDPTYSMFVKVSDIETNTNSIELYVNQTFNLEATIKPTNATVKLISYESDNSEIATVSNTGVVRAKKQGKCSIVIRADDNYEFKKVIPVNVLKEDRNRQKKGTIKVTTNLDLTSLAGENEQSQILQNLNLNSSELYAPIVNTYNTTDEDFVDLSENVKILNDINYYGIITGESRDERNERIFNNMKILFATSFAANTLLSNVGASDSSSYSKYSSSISSNFLEIAAAKLALNKAEESGSVKAVQAAKQFYNSTITNSPEQHSLNYINHEYLSNAKLEQTASTRKCTYYSYQKNDINSQGTISSISSLINNLNVNSVKNTFTQARVNEFVNLIKTNFDKLPPSYSQTYEILRLIINNIDENSYTISTSDIYKAENNKDAVDVNLSLTEEGLGKISTLMVDYITTKISASENEELKNRITNYINGLAFENFSLSITFVNKDGGGVDIYKFENNISYKTALLNNQSINILLKLDLNKTEIPSTFFFEEEERQTIYKNS